MKTKILPIFIAVLAALAAGLGFWKLDRSRQQTYRTVSRLRVYQKASPLRSALETALNGRLESVRILADFTAGNPNVSQKEFESFARHLAHGDTVVRSHILARHSTVSAIFPMAGNEKAVGFDILADPEQRGAAERALRIRGTVLAGPVKLVEGGTAFIGRAPVYGMPSRKAERDTVAWGLAMVLIRSDALYHEAGLAPFSGNLRFAMRGRDGLGPKGGVFFGDERLFRANPVLLDVRFPNGSWQLAAAPAGGWLKTAPGSLKYRIFGALMALGMGILMFPFSRNVLRLI